MKEFEAAISIHQIPWYSNRPLISGLLLSLSLHLVFFGLLFLQTRSRSEPKQYILNVEFEPLSPPIPSYTKRDSSEVPNIPELPNQIVSEPENSGNTGKRTKEARFLAEKNATTEKEQIKRGDGEDVGKTLGKSLSKKKEESVKENTKEKDPVSIPNKSLAISKPLDLSDLKLSHDELMKEISPQNSKQPSASSLSSSPNLDIESYEAFSRPAGSGAKFLGIPGMADHIPNLPDGDITMLNTKASHFAVFVRRVAIQVFGQLRAVGWAQMQARDIQAITQFCTVRATLSPKGDLIRATVESSSGSYRFDEVVRLAAQIGAKDPYPPAEALSDNGTFEFIFKARSWVRLRSNPRTGMPSEARWLLLGTGLE